MSVTVTAAPASAAALPVVYPRPSTPSLPSAASVLQFQTAGEGGVRDAVPAYAPSYYPAISPASQSWVPQWPSVSGRSSQSELRAPLLTSAQ